MFGVVIGVVAFRQYTNTELFNIQNAVKTKKKL